MTLLIGATGDWLFPAAALVAFGTKRPKLGLIALGVSLLALALILSEHGVLPAITADFVGEPLTFLIVMLLVATGIQVAGTWDSDEISGTAMAAINIVVIPAITIVFALFDFHMTRGQNIGLIALVAALFGVQLYAFQKIHWETRPSWYFVSVLLGILLFGVLAITIAFHPAVRY